MRFNGIGSVCIGIDSYENGEVKGRVLSAVHKEPDQFDGALGLIKCLNNLLDCADAPQSTMKLRSFVKPEEPVKKQQIFAESSTVNANMPTLLGKRATFSVRIMYRRNASWQGVVYWEEENKEESFRSALELFLLMTDALNQPYTGPKPESED